MDFSEGPDSLVIIVLSLLLKELFICTVFVPRSGLAVLADHLKQSFKLFFDETLALVQDPESWKTNAAKTRTLLRHDRPSVGEDLPFVVYLCALGRVGGKR
ncbi:hypothetical protein ACLGGT_21055 [Roseovarius sp. MS2]|uniref:hypothetical protein n=1 Tax=Roseovarius TaxID=74030 RepID=UPI003EDC62A7